MTDAYIRPGFDSVIDNIKPNGAAIFRQLESLARVKVTHVTQNIKAIAGSATIASELKIPRRSACLHIVRCYRDAEDKVLEISSSYHPAEGFVYSMRIDLEQ